MAGLLIGGVAQAEPVAVRSVIASGDDGNVAANTLDGDLSTRWSDEGNGVWIRYDLGAETTLGSLAIAWHNGDERRATFEVQTSSDGTSWATVVNRRTSSGTTRQAETYDFVDRAARYVRVVGYGNTVNDWTSITEVDVFGADAPGGECDYPADVLDLSGWKVQLPIGAEEDPDEVTQPALATYAVDPWFRATDDCDGVLFRSAVNGVTTGGSSYPRSELREMTADGSDETGWSATDGTHTMVIREAITALPADKPHVVAGQIHDGDDDVAVFRLEGTRLYVTKGDTTHHKLVDDDYVLGTPFEAKFVVSGGSVKAYYNGVLQTTISASFPDGYFKAGAYTQANCGNSDPCDESNYGEVVIHDIAVTHS
ncbi:polysaccharide lyase family 7 protein [Actinophytocola sp. NPDC049390]|uniref:polysaccharide lyase family 7 protein n=1 Tax=Actinophytocola sp. NPDC049390 TaxID=3363894 RepID=UPI003787CDA8